MPTIFGCCARMASATSTTRWLMSNSRIFARDFSSPRLAIKYRSPNAQWAYLAFSVVRTMSDTSEISAHDGRLVQHLLQDVHVEQPAKLAADLLHRSDVDEPKALVQMQARIAALRHARD